MRPTHDKRRRPRIRTRFQALHFDDRQEGVGVLANVSECGALMKATSTQPRLGTCVRVQTDIPDRSEPLELEGRVIRHTDDGFAIEFEKLNLEVRRLIEEDAALGAVLGDSGEDDAPTSGHLNVREIAIRCWADGVCLSGGIFLPGRRSLVDHLNQQVFLKLQNVEIPGGELLPFLALRRDSISVLVPPDAVDCVDRDHSVGKFTNRRITCLLRGSTIIGTLELLQAVRVSDHLMRATQFIALRDCELRLPASAEASALPRSAPLVLVNTRHVVGITEEG